ncbi:hypothetical protein [uncultured Flavobacterium sp.]|uniref:hypothetical protein n=1 Tax=uncultured Flavobacterium sp. TaxID=165435 RepID=UPI0030EFA2CE|tara:strand:+ start:30140 stop:30430 length:291 start_codon:yes stop_codon:yes gene_type:complete
MKNKEPQSLFFTYGIKNVKLFILTITLLIAVSTLVGEAFAFSKNSTNLSVLLFTLELASGLFFYGLIKALLRKYNRIDTNNNLCLVYRGYFKLTLK